jgi:hypothetical protein
MKPLKFFIILTLAILMLVPMVSALEYTGASRTATMSEFVKVSLGIENAPGMTLTKATLYYNWISIAFIFLIGAMSSKRMTRFFAILVPVFAALFVWLGWMHAPNPIATWGTIVMCGIIGVVTYMKGSLRENYGSGGVGNTLINIVFYLIILQTCVGMVNSTAMWNNPNTNITQNNYADASQFDYQMDAPNAQLTTSLPSVSKAGGFWSTFSSAGMGIVDAAVGAGYMFLSVLVSVGCFAIIINSIFPFIGQTTQGAFLLIGIQIGIWFLYGLAFVAFFAKPFPDSIAT